MSNEYTHVLRSRVADDPFVNPDLFITDITTENWEHFINGQWVSGDPLTAGTYLVCLKKNISAIAEAIPAKNNKKRFIWKDPKLRNKIIVHWHRPIPHAILEP